MLAALSPLLGLHLLLVLLSLPIPEAGEADSRADALTKHTTALWASWRPS